MSTAENIFSNAREFSDPEQQRAYVEAECQGNGALRAEVEELLAAAAAAEQFFASPQDQANVPESAGMVISRYRLLEKIGEGGMGVVYMAEQREPVKRKVALKVIKLGMDTRQVIARFEAERQALALMDHPNIARVLDAGSTESGRPYFVMDLVQGWPITTFADRANLSLGERLRIFLDVCSAIHHAHQKGVIHRDLKPSNILVTLHGEKPVPKVIDFGIAKAIDQPLTEKTLFTRFQQFLGTPAYTSPEQASLSGIDVDIRSDIYGLGVLLYELLTGKTPFDPNEIVSGGLDTLRRTILEKEPELPSTTVEKSSEDPMGSLRTRAQSAELRGDLDWIVMKCLEKDRERRYESARAVAEDIQRHLANEPVMASPPSRFYRFGKFARRNRAGLIVGAFAVVFLLLFSTVSAWQAWRATQAERNARAQERIAQSVRDFLTEQLLAGTNPYKDPVYDSVKPAMLKRIATAMEGRFVDQPLVEADLRYALTEGFAGYNDHLNVLPNARRALELRLKHLGPDHTNTMHAAARLAYAYQGLGREAEAKSLLEDVIARAERTQQSFTLANAQAHQILGNVLRSTDTHRALEHLHTASNVYARVLGPTNTEVTSVEWSINSCAIHLDLPETERLLIEAAEKAQRLHGPGHSYTAIFWKSYGFFLSSKGRHDEARTILERAINGSKQSFGPDHLLSIDADHIRAWNDALSGETERAAATFLELATRFSNAPPARMPWEHVASYANFFIEKKRYNDALAAYRSLQTITRQAARESPLAFKHLLTATAALHGWAAAADLCANGLNQHGESAEVLQWKAWTLASTRRRDELRRAVAKALQLKDPKVAVEIAALADEFSPEERTEWLRRMATLQNQVASLEGTARLEALRSLTQLQLKLNLYPESLKTFSEFGIPDSELTAIDLFIRAICLHRTGQSSAAVDTFRRGETLAQSRVGDIPSNFLTPSRYYRYVMMRDEAARALGIELRK